MMALEVIREIVGFGEGLVGRLVMLDARAMRFETLRYAWDPENPLSGEQPTIRDLSGHALIVTGFAGDRRCSAACRWPRPRGSSC